PAVLQMSGSQPQVGRGVPCLRCRGLCTGFEPHSWRKICKSCKCSQEEHGLSSELDDDRRIGRLLSDSKYSSLTARLKGGDGARIYKRNRMIVTNPNISGKDPTFDTVTYEWAPPGLTQKLVRGSRAGQDCSGRVTGDGEPGFAQRAEMDGGLRVLEKSAHSSRARKHSVSSSTVSLDFLGKRAVPISEVGLCQGRWGGHWKPLGGRDRGRRRWGNARGAGRISDQAEKTTWGAEGLAVPVPQRCDSCQQPLPGEFPVVYADRAGYSRQWHPACFVCCRCAEPLVDLIYFWKGGAAWCGRHYCESLRPRCAGCDEIIFSEDYQQVEGLAWHNKHFACLECETLLTGKPFTLAKGSLLCSTCSQSR
ncbi:LMCD1 protein, partial [Aegithalos caudatus]|nr:LMCD1 protein [Aegithalos caudatus]